MCSDPNHYNSATCASYTDPTDPPYTYTGWLERGKPARLV